jgi:hypothetical protein
VITAERLGIGVGVGHWNWWLMGKGLVGVDNASTSDIRPPRVVHLGERGAELSWKVECYGGNVMQKFRDHPFNKSLGTAAAVRYSTIAPAGAQRQ